jgi:rod shape-determining protein MreB and related proteins
MLSALFPLLYIKVAPERLTVRNVKTGEEIAEVPEVAIGSSHRKKIILAVGAQARAAASVQSAELVNPFDHPRTLVGDFTVGEQLLKAFLRRLQSASWFALSPRIVMHPLGSPAGGFTQVERRAFREMAIGAGASEVVLWVGRELSDEEVQSDEVLQSEKRKGDA